MIHEDGQGTLIVIQDVLLLWGHGSPIAIVIAYHSLQGATEPKGDMILGTYKVNEIQEMKGSEPSVGQF
ncbi:hypothetical protein E2C01_035570 [Portunus trituberculatus]|uniref:Uncharacterized protein n=1 Tax=Portunus trituberculatus TaxID=210409 RepID=A0A5B7F9P7_PORTR|nr:hypothetical protein [Portunus trituberculatus]